MFPRDVHGRPRSGRAAIKNVHLTEREVECLIGAAKGKQFRVGESARARTRRLHLPDLSALPIFLSLKAREATPSCSRISCPDVRTGSEQKVAEAPDVAKESPGNWIRPSVLYELGDRLAYQMALAYQPKFGLPMNLKLLMAGTIFATAPIVAFAQNDEPADQAPKSTLADAQKVVSCLSTPRLKADQTAACPNPSREVLVDQLIGRTTSVSRAQTIRVLRS